jgi:thiamine transporter ThiT
MQKQESNSRLQLLRMILAALFLAVAYLLPFVTGQIPRIGKMLCPMHIPVLLCGFLCGWGWGAAIGFIAPLLRSLTLGVPLFFPQAVAMAFELAAYGAVAGFLYRRLGRNVRSLYASLLIAMVIGRLVWGSAMVICMGLGGAHFGWLAFLSGAVLQAIPGIIAQIILIPILVRACERYFPIE